MVRPVRTFPTSPVQLMQPAPGLAGSFLCRQIRNLNKSWLEREVKRQARTKVTEGDSNIVQNGHVPNGLHGLGERRKCCLQNRRRVAEPRT
eukprot:6179036-Pleurochrysis_carterae.AAC.1